MKNFLNKKLCINLILSLLTVGLSAQSLEVTSTYFFNTEKEDYFINEGETRTLKKLFNAYEINPKLSYISLKGWIFSLNKTNFGVYTEGETEINSKVSSVGFGFGKEWRIGFILNNNMFGITPSERGKSFALNFATELRLNYNYAYEGVQIKIEGEHADLIETKDAIEKFTPEFLIKFSPSIGLFGGWVEVNFGLQAHLLFAPMLNKKFTNNNSTNERPFEENQDIVLLGSLAGGIRINLK